MTMTSSVTWTEAFSSFSPAGTSWQDYDIYTNLSVPKGAIAAILIRYNSTGTTVDVGVRTNGSSLSRYLRIHPYVQSTGGGRHMMYVKVNASDGLIETYASTTSNVTFYLLGYWTGVDFTEKWDSAMPGSAGAWTDVNLNTVSGVPAGQVASILLGNGSTTAAYTMGARINGSALTRSIPLRIAVTSGAFFSYTMSVKTDGSGIVEIWAGATSGTAVYCTGYFSSALDYTEAAPGTGAVANASAWTTNDWDLSASLDRDGRVTDIICAHTRNGAYAYTVGVRTHGSGAGNRYLVSDRADGTGYAPATYPTQTGAADGILELWSSNASYEYIRFLGYYKEMAYSDTTTDTVSAADTDQRNKSLVEADTSSLADTDLRGKTIVETDTTTSTDTDSRGKDITETDTAGFARVLLPRA